MAMPLGMFFVVMFFKMTFFMMMMVMRMSRIMTVKMMMRMTVLMMPPARFHSNWHRQGQPQQHHKRQVSRGYCFGFHREPPYRK